MTKQDGPEERAEPLRRLPFGFGEKIARRIATPSVAAQQCAVVTPHLRGYEARGAPNDFFATSALLRLGNLDLLSYASSRVTIDLAASGSSEFVVMLAGNVALTQRSGGRRVLYNSNIGILSGGAAHLVEASQCSGVVARVDPGRLLRTLDAMAGGRDHGLDRDHLHDTQSFRMQCGRIDLKRVFQVFFQTLDALSSHAAFHDYRIPEILGLDDQFYRLAALSLAPDLLWDDHGSVPPVARDSIDMLCDAIRNSRDRFVTLTEMESMTGLARRTLQHHFLKRFQCSPMTWQRRERLHIAHDRLKRGETDGLNIAELGYELGFASPSSFADFYRRMFGETPGATLRRRKTGGG
jgi:AraC-like DNA-binding protein